MPSGSAPNTSLVLTDAEIDYINTHHNGSKSAAIHKALEIMMDEYTEAAEAVNRLTQNQFSSKADIQQSEEEADEAYGQVIDALYGK